MCWRRARTWIHSTETDFAEEDTNCSRATSLHRPARRSSARTIGPVIPAPPRRLRAAPRRVSDQGRTRLLPADRVDTDIEPFGDGIGWPLHGGEDKTSTQYPSALCRRPRRGRLTGWPKLPSPPRSRSDSACSRARTSAGQLAGLHGALLRDIRLHHRWPGRRHEAAAVSSALRRMAMSSVYAIYRASHDDYTDSIVPVTTTQTPSCPATRRHSTKAQRP